jgi:L-lactate utilization protein LutB
MDQNKQWWIEKRCEKAADKLKSHGFDAIYVRTKEEAVREILKYVTPATKVGAGGSVTIRQLGILDTMRAQGNTVFDHWIPGLSKEQSIEIRKSQMTCDLFLSSSNAITMHGELVNIDGVGNRVNAMTFGPKKVIVVASYNKLVETVEEAINRVRTVATPANSKRLNLDVPCGKVGVCTDCNSPDRSCRVIVILERKPHLSDILVILVGEELGY